MYLATQYGFYNARRDEGKPSYTVRSFLRSDLENLLGLSPDTDDLEIEEKQDAYYPFRVRMSVEQFIASVGRLCKTADYDSFGDRIRRLGDQRSKLKSYQDFTDAIRKYGTEASGDEASEGRELRFTAGWSNPEGAEPPPITLENLETVLGMLPHIEQQVRIRENRLAAGDEIGYEGEFSRTVRVFVEELFRQGFMFSFDYQSWLDEARRIAADEKLLAAADLMTIRKMLVCHWRADYWDWDHTHWEEIVMNGELIAIMKRMKAIHDEMTA